MEAESLPPASGQAPLGVQIINVELIDITRGLAAQPSINNDKCFAKVAGEALPDPKGHAQIIIILFLISIILFFHFLYGAIDLPSLFDSGFAAMAKVEIRNK
jgi:hypothetical protein